jgi:hypothetical protein
MSLDTIRTINPPEGDDQIGRPGWRWDHATNVLVAIGVTLLAAGLLALAAAAGDYARARAAADWPSVPGVVSTSEATTTRLMGRGISLVPWANIAYSYEVGGQTYTSGQITLRPPVPDAGGKTAASLLSAYPLGAEVTVYYDPSDPATAVLERERPAEALRSGLILLGAAAVVLLIAWAMRRVGAPGARTAAKARSKQLT